MVIDHSHRLHKSIADGRSDKTETALFKGFGHGSTLRCFGRHLSLGQPSVGYGLATDEGPDVSRKIRSTLLNGQIS